MRLRHRLAALDTEHETIAAFGGARLVRNAAGRLELLGGTDEDREQARQWVRMFLSRADDRRAPTILES